MDRATIRRQLELAMDHVARGARIVAQHRLLIVKLKGLGRDTAEAEKLLATLEEIQAIQVLHRDRLLKQLLENKDE